MSMPLSAASTVEWVPPQSDITKPSKPNSVFRMSFSIGAFSHA